MGILIDSGVLEALPTLRVGTVIEVTTLRRLWKDGVPASVRKKPNHRPAKTAEWTAGWEWVEVRGEIVENDGDHIRLKMRKNGRGERPLGGVFTTVNHGRIRQFDIIETCFGQKL